MENIIDEEFTEVKKAKPRVFSTHEIATGAFIGGALAGAYFLAHNFKVFGEPQKSATTWIASIIYTSLLLVSLFYIPILEHVPNMAFTAAVTGAFYGAAHHYQEKLIEDYLSDGGTTNSWLKTVGISLLFAIVFGGLIFGWAYFSDPGMTASSKSYGELNHELSYTENITEAEADNVANGLMYAQYFGMDMKSYAYVDQENGKYLIYLAIVEDAYQNPEVATYYQLVHDDTEEFSQLDISIHLVEDDITDIKLTID